MDNTHDETCFHCSNRYPRFFCGEIAGAFSRISVAAPRSFSFVAIVVLSSSIFASAAPIFAVSSAIVAEARSEAPFPVLISNCVSFDSSLQKSVNSS